MADFAVTTLGLKKVAVLNLNTDWGKTSFDLFSGRVKEIGGEVVASEAYLPDEKDFRSAITRLRDAQPDGIVLISYQADGALIAQQLRDAGLKQPIVGGGSLQSPDYLKLGGAAVEGSFVLGEFLASDPRPEVKTFVDKYKARYNQDVNRIVERFDLGLALAAAVDHLTQPLLKPTTVNIHGSLLPKYRGAAPINHALLNGETETGLTSFFLTADVDRGNIIGQVKTAIEPDENFSSLYKRLSEMAGPFLLESLDKISSPGFVPKKQDDSLASPAPKIKPEGFSK